MVQLEYATVQNGAARWSQNWHFVPKSTAKRFFPKYLSEAVTPPSKILHAHSTSDREWTCQETEKNTHKLFCTKPPKFPQFGGPYLLIGDRYPHAFTAIR